MHSIYQFKDNADLRKSSSKNVSTKSHKLRLAIDYNLNEQIKNHKHEKLIMLPSLWCRR